MTSTGEAPSASGSDSVKRARKGVMIGMAVAGDVPERQRVVDRPLDLAAGEGAGGVAVDQ